MVAGEEGIGDALTDKAEAQMAVADTEGFGSVSEAGPSLVFTFQTGGFTRHFYWYRARFCVSQ